MPLNVTNRESLYEYLIKGEYSADIRQLITQRALRIFDYNGFIDELYDAIEDATGETVPKSLLEDIELETYAELYPEVSHRIRTSAAVSGGSSAEHDAARSFWTDFHTNATDPFKGIENYARRFTKDYERLHSPRPANLDALAVDTNSRLNSPPSYEPEYLRQGLRGAVEYGARQLVAAMPEINQSLVRQTDNYAEPARLTGTSQQGVTRSSGFIMRPTGLDVYSMLTSQENSGLGFKGFVYQLQSKTALAGVLNRTGPTQVGTQGYTDILDSSSMPTTATGILAGNDLSARTAELYNQGPARVVPVFQQRGQIHAKLGYFYEQDNEKDDAVGAISKIFIGTQNWTSTLDRSTTIEEMLLLNRDTARDRNAFDILAQQTKAAVDSLLELQTSSRQNPEATRTEFRTRYEQKLGVLNGPRVLFVNEEIHTKIASKLESAASSGDQKVILSIQYLESALDPRKKSHQLGGSPFGVGQIGFEALKNLASSGQLSIALTSTSHVESQGLFRLLDNYYRMGAIKDTTGLTHAQRERYDLVTSLLESNAFSIMPSQFLHSKSFAILDSRNQLKAYGIGSSNISAGANRQNIETMAIFESESSYNTLNILDAETERDIQQSYFYGYSRFFKERSDYQGLLIEQRGREEIARDGFDFLRSMGGVEATSWDSKAAKGKKFIFSRRYLVGQGGARVVGAKIQIANPLGDEAGYSFDVTFGAERTVNAKGPDGMQPVVYLNKSQRLIAGMVYKNATGENRVYKVYDEETGATNEIALKHGETYQANAFDVLGGLINTTYHAMRYEYQVRGMYATYGMMEKDVFAGTLRQYVGTSINQILSAGGTPVAEGGTNDLYEVAGLLANQLSTANARNRGKIRQQLQTQLTSLLATPIGDYAGYRPNIANTTGMAHQRLTEMNEAVNKLITGITNAATQNTATPENIGAIVDRFTSQLVTQVNTSLNLGNWVTGQNNFTGLYNDLIMQAIEMNPTLASIYKSEIEKGKKESFSNQIDIFSQPHETGFSHGQGFFRLPGYGEDQYINNAYSILRDQDDTGFIMSPYALMHGESLGAYSGQYLRAVASSGRLKFQDSYTRYGGLLKLEGGAPVVHELEGLMQSMPGLGITKRREYTLQVFKSLKQAGYTNRQALTSAKQLAEASFSRYRAKAEKAAGLGEAYDSDDELIYFFPFAKSEQISQRMKNLTSTRPIFNASSEFVKYAMSFGADLDYDPSRSVDSLGGNIFSTLTAQQYKALREEYVSRYQQNNPDTLLTPAEMLSDANIDTRLLRTIAKEWTVDQKQITKGYLGGVAPRRLVIAAGASQLSDYGMLNANFRDNKEDQYALSYVQPHVVQATSTLDSFIASPSALNKVINEKLKPGTIFLAKDLLVTESSVVNQLKRRLNLQVQTTYFTQYQNIPNLSNIPAGDLNLTNYIESVQQDTGLDAVSAKRLVMDSLRELKEEFRNIKIEYGRGLDNVNFYYKKGVYSPGSRDELGNSQLGKLNYIESMSLIGELIGSEGGQGLTFTINDLFNYSTTTGDGRVKPMMFRIPAVSARELGPAISVLSEAHLTVNTGNTVILDLDLQTLKDFKEGIRGGLQTAKGPMRSAEAEFWKAIDGFTEGTKSLLPRRVAAQDVFAMLSSSQIKGFNFEMGLGLLEEKEQSGIYQLVNRPEAEGTVSGGRAVAEALAMLLLSRKDLSDISGLRGALEQSLRGSQYSDGGSRAQYAEALRVRNAANPNQQGQPLTGIAADLDSSLDYFGSLAALVDPGLLAGRSLQEALALQVRIALGDDASAQEARSRLQSGAVSLFRGAFQNSFKTDEYAYTNEAGEDESVNIYSHLDDFGSRPVGLLAFLLKASQDVYRDVNVTDRLRSAGLAEVSLSNQSIFTGSYDPSDTTSEYNAYLHTLSSLMPQQEDSIDQLRTTLRRHEATELVRQLGQTAGTDLTGYTDRLNAIGDNQVEAYVNKLTETLTSQDDNVKNRLKGELRNLESQFGISNFNVDTLTQMLQVEAHPLTKAYKDVLVQAAQNAGWNTEQINQYIDLKLRGPSAEQDFRQFITNPQFNLFKSRLAPALRTNLAAQRTGQDLQTDSLIEKLNNLNLDNTQIQQLLTAYGEDGESRLLKYGKDHNLATYTALEMYGRFGELGKKLGTGIEEIARRFGYSLPDDKEIKHILERVKRGESVTPEEERKLREVEAVFSAIRAYIQTQRMIELPGEYTPGKLTVPTGMKNITAMEGHYAQGLTAKQLSTYTYNPKDAQDVGTIQQALVSLAIIYENSVPSQRKVASKYNLQMQNLGDNAALQFVMQKELLEQERAIDPDSTRTVNDLELRNDLRTLQLEYTTMGLLRNTRAAKSALAAGPQIYQASAYDFATTFLTNYTSFGRHEVPGHIDRLGAVEVRPVGVAAVHDYVGLGSQYINDGRHFESLQNMIRYADLTRHNLGNNLDYEQNINQRVDLVLAEIERGALLRSAGTNTETIVEAVRQLAQDDYQQRVSLGEDFDMTEFLDSIYRSRTRVDLGSQQAITLSQLSREEAGLQKQIILAMQSGASFNEARQIGAGNYAQTQRDTIHQRIVNTFRNNTGAEYLEGMETLHASAKQQQQYFRQLLETETDPTIRLELQAKLTRAQSLMGSVETSRFISLPSIVVLDRYKQEADPDGGTRFTGKTTVRTGAERSVQTGVILGLDILQKMSLLFNSESHPALEAQYRLIAKLQKTQSVIDRIQFNALKGQTTDLTNEQLADIEELQVLMHQSKETAIDLVHNKNSIRQATANRLGMSGTSYIAVNSFLVGMEEVGLGSRILRAAGVDSGDGIKRLGAAADKEMKYQVESFKLLTAGGFRGRVMFELTVRTEMERLRDFLTNLPATSTEAQQAQQLLTQLDNLGSQEDPSAVAGVLANLKRFIEQQEQLPAQLRLAQLQQAEAANTIRSSAQIELMESTKLARRRLANLDRSIAFVQNTENVTRQNAYLSFGVSSRTLGSLESRIQNKTGYIQILEGKIDKKQQQIAAEEVKHGHYLTKLNERIARKEEAIAREEAKIAVKQQKIQETQQKIVEKEAAVAAKAQFLADKQEQYANSFNYLTQTLPTKIERKDNFIASQTNYLQRQQEVHSDWLEQYNTYVTQELPATIIKKQEAIRKKDLYFRKQRLAGQVEPSSSHMYSARIGALHIEGNLPPDSANYVNVDPRFARLFGTSDEGNYAAVIRNTEQEIQNKFAFIDRQRDSFFNLRDVVVRKAQQSTNLKQTVIPAVQRNLNALNEEITNYASGQTMTRHQQIMLSLLDSIETKQLRHGVGGQDRQRVIVSDIIPEDTEQHFVTRRDYLHNMQRVQRHLTRYDGLLPEAIVPNDLNISQLSMDQIEQVYTQVENRVIGLLRSRNGERFMRAVANMPQRLQQDLIEKQERVVALGSERREVGARMGNVLQSINTTLGRLGLAQERINYKLTARQEMEMLQREIPLIGLNVPTEVNDDAYRASIISGGATDDQLYQYRLYQMQTAQRREQKARRAKYPTLVPTVNQVNLRIQDQEEYDKATAKLLDPTLTGFELRQKASDFVFPIARPQNENLYQKINRLKQLQLRANTKAYVANLQLRGPAALLTDQSGLPANMFYNEDGWPKFLTGQLEYLQTQSAAKHHLVPKLHNLSMGLYGTLTEGIPYTPIYTPDPVTSSTVASNTVETDPDVINLQNTNRDYGNSITLNVHTLNTSALSPILPTAEGVLEQVNSTVENLDGNFGGSATLDVNTLKAGLSATLAKSSMELLPSVSLWRNNALPIVGQIEAAKEEKRDLQLKRIEVRQQLARDSVWLTGTEDPNLPSPTDLTVFPYEIGQPRAESPLAAPPPPPFQVPSEIGGYQYELTNPNASDLGGTVYLHGGEGPGSFITTQMNYGLDRTGTNFDGASVQTQLTILEADRDYFLPRKISRLETEIGYPGSVDQPSTGSHYPKIDQIRAEIDEIVDERDRLSPARHAQELNAIQREMAEIQLRIQKNQTKTADLQQQLNERQVVYDEYGQLDPGRYNYQEVMLQRAKELGVITHSMKPLGVETRLFKEGDTTKDFGGQAITVPLVLGGNWAQTERSTLKQNLLSGAFEVSTQPTGLPLPGGVRFSTGTTYGSLSTHMNAATGTNGELIQTGLPKEWFSPPKSEEAQLVERIIYSKETQIDVILGELASISDQLTASLQVEGITDEQRTELTQRLQQVEEAVSFVENKRTQTLGPSYFKLNIDYNLNQQQLDVRLNEVEGLLAYAQNKLTVQNYNNQIDRLNALEGQQGTVNSEELARQETLLSNMTPAFEQATLSMSRLTQQQRQAYEAQIQQRVGYANIQPVLNSNEDVIETEERQVVRLLRQEADVYGNYPDVGKLTKQLSHWANLLRKYAALYDNPQWQAVTEQELFRRLMNNEDLTYIVAATIMGQDFNPMEIDKVVDRIEEKVGAGAVLTGRQGAPFGTSSPTSGHALNAIAKQSIRITETNRRAQELNSYFVSNESAASTLMLLSAFGFEFTGLGDYDGDSFQAALSKINQATGTISENTVQIKRFERQLMSLDRDQNSNAGLNVSASEYAAQRAWLESQILLAKGSITQAESIIDAAKEEVLRTKQGRAEYAYEGLRSYIGSYTALPQQLVGNKQITGATVFKDEALRGMVKQFRDTLGGFSLETGLQRGEIGRYTYINNILFDGDSKIQGIGFSAGIHELGDRAINRVQSNFMFWAQQFEQSSSYQAFLASQTQGINTQDYVSAVSEYQAQTESTVMSMFSMSKILGNVSGTTIDPEGLGSMQAIMGTTGGSLLGKVYNTVVPISAGLSANISFNRMLLDPDMVKSFNESVERGFSQVEADGNVGDALELMKNQLTQNAVTAGEIVPWRMATRNTEEMNSTIYRLLLTTQQYLRDSALKPKQAGGLSGRLLEYTVSPAALEQLRKIGVTEQEELSALKGYAEIIQRESQYTDQDQRAKYIQIISQDFLGTMANKGLAYNYGGDVTGVTVEETSALTSFAALKLLTDYVGGTGNSARNLMDNSSYGETLKHVKERYQAALETNSLDPEIARQIVVDGAINDSKLTTFVLADMLNKFQAQFIIDANLENMDYIKNEETDAALKFYGLNAEGTVVDQNALRLASAEDHIKNVQSYLDIKVGGEADVPQTFKDFSQTAFGILNGIEGNYETLNEKLAAVEEMAGTLLQQKYGPGEALDNIQGRLADQRSESEEQLAAQQHAIRSAINQQKTKDQTASLSDKSLTKAVFGGLIEHTVAGQTQQLIPALENLRAFNQAVSEIAANGQTSRLHEALIDQQKTYSSLAIEFQAQQYALDAGKLVGESLPKAFAKSVLDIVDAVNQHQGRTDADGNKIPLTETETRAVFAALSLGGAIPQNVLPMIEATTQGLDTSERVEFQNKLIQALTADRGALEQVASANAYQHAQMGMASLQNTLTEMIAQKTAHLATLDVSSAEAQSQIIELENLRKEVDVLNQSRLNEGYLAYEEEQRNLGERTFESPANDVMRRVHKIIDQTDRSMELRATAQQQAALHQQLQRMNTVAEGVSILAVPLLFSMMQGDIPITQQLTSLSADVIQSAVMYNSYEESALRSFVSPNTDTASLKRMANVANKFQFGRMQQFLMNYESPTEGLARAALSELVYSGAVMTGSLLGQAVDSRRSGLAGVEGIAGQTGVGRIVTEVASGVIGMAVGGMISQRPLPETTVSQDEFMADVVKSMMSSAQNIYNYLSQNLLGNEEDSDDMEVMETDGGVPISVERNKGDIVQSAAGGTNVALSIQEYIQVISEDTDSPTTAQLLGFG